MTSPSQLARVQIVACGFEMALIASGNAPELARTVALERARNAVQVLDGREDAVVLSDALHAAELPCYGGCRVLRVIGISKIVEGIAAALRIHDRASARIAALHARAEHVVDHESEQGRSGAVHVEQSGIRNEER